MRRIAPWIAAGIVVALLVANLVLTVIATGDAGRVESVSREVAELHQALAAARGELDQKLDARLADIETKLEAGHAPPVVKDLTPPPGKLVASFDDGTQGWRTPPWGAGSARFTEKRDMYRRGGGGLALGYSYGPKPPAVEGKVAPGGKVRAITLHARTLVRTVTVAVGVVEAGGARYEVRLPKLAPGEGWRRVTVEPGRMSPVPGFKDADRRLDAAKIIAIHVVDRSRAAVGGNVLLIDDVAIETAE